MKASNQSILLTSVGPNVSLSRFHLPAKSPPSASSWQGDDPSLIFINSCWRRTPPAALYVYVGGWIKQDWLASLRVKLWWAKWSESVKHLEEVLCFWWMDECIWTFFSWLTLIRRNSRWHKCDVGKSRPALARRRHIPRPCREGLWCQRLNFPPAPSGLITSRGAKRLWNIQKAEQISSPWLSVSRRSSVTRKAARDTRAPFGRSALHLTLRKIAQTMSR